MATDIVWKLCIKCANSVKATGKICCEHYRTLLDDIHEACGYIGKPKSNKIVSIDPGIFDVSYHKEHVYCHKFAQKKVNNQ